MDDTLETISPLPSSSPQQIPFECENETKTSLKKKITFTGERKKPFLLLQEWFIDNLLLIFSAKVGIKCTRQYFLFGLRCSLVLTYVTVLEGDFYSASLTKCKMEPSLFPYKTF